MITENRTSLREHNSFHVDASCKKLIPIRQERDVYAALLEEPESIKIIGGGSNVLLAGDLDDTVLLNQIKGIEVIDEDEDQILIRVGGGEIWHNVVLWSISHGYHGLQNLSLIPGSVGAAPIQNIGAYGVEQSEYFHSLRAVDLEEKITRVFYKEDCQFGYRDSVFKKAQKGRFFITHVSYLLSKKGTLNVTYGAIKQRLADQGITEPSLKELSDTICAIRQTKLPDPIKVGNAGSFFKNPIVAQDKYEALLERFPDIVAYPQGDNMKLSAGWLIERAGWKGKSINGAKVYDKHALVLVNDGTSEGLSIWSLAQKIIKDIDMQYGIRLEPEVNIWGT